MWKKDDQPERPTTQSSGSVPPPRTATPVGSTRTESTDRAIIGPSISITGEVSGDEDLLIQGRIDGTVNLEQHAVTVGREGRVKAGISGRVVVVEGAVEGDLRALEQIILRSSAQVSGDVVAPRVVLEDGASFRGRVDMSQPAKGGGQRSAGTVPKQASVSELKRPDATDATKEAPPKKAEAAAD